jgi:hypothetical protein
MQYRPVRNPTQGVIAVTDGRGETPAPPATSPSPPDGEFAAGAAAALAPVARDLETVHERVRDGDLHLDEQAAQQLLGSLSALRSRVETLIADGRRRIDRPLPLGDNFVGHTMSDSLQGAAGGGTGAAIPVLEEFGRQLERLQDIVSRAAGLIADTDAGAGERLSKLGEIH